MTTRPLHAVLIPSRAAAGQLLGPLRAALDGTGPALLPLDAALPRARLEELLAAFRPAAVRMLGGEDAAGAGPGRDGRHQAGRDKGEPDWGAGRPALPRPGGGEPEGVAPGVAVVLATSGSTGMPKGAELPADALRASARASLARLGAGPGARWLCCLPAHHASGLGVLVRSLESGSVPVAADRADPATIAAALRDGCEFVSLVPAQLRRLIDAGAPLARFRAILLGGAAAPRGLLASAAAAGARVVTTYGMTETCGGCVYDGVPLDGVRVRAGGDGRVRIAGPVLFSGYRLAPGLTREALDGGWFITSDLGEVGGDGRLVIRGRADDVINTGGEKVVAQMVEEALRDCPGIRDAVVVGAPDRDWGERVTAVVVPRDPADPPDLGRLRAALAGRLPGHAAPRALLVVPEIPMLASGKPDRQALRLLAARPGTWPAA